MNTLRALFGQKLRQVRRQKNMTQERLAEAIDASVDLISNIERGINAPSFKTLERLAEALDVPVKELFEFSGLS